MIVVSRIADRMEATEVAVRKSLLTLGQHIDEIRTRLEKLEQRDMDVTKPLDVAALPDWAERARSAETPEKDDAG